MSDLRPPLKRVLDTSLSETEIQRMWRGIQRAPAHATTPNRAAMAGALFAFVLSACVWLFVTHGSVQVDSNALGVVGGEPLRPSAVLQGSRSHVVALTDGSRIELGEAARLDVLENTRSTFVVHLREGTSTFEVKPGGPRRWTIECGLATVEVVGTGFTIERTLDAVRVRVSHGVVLVRGERVPDRVHQLVAGEELRVEGDTPKHDGDGVVKPPDGVAGPSALDTPGAREAARAPQGAPQVIPRVRSPEAADGGLLGAADDARRNGRRAEAVQLLERAMRQNPGSPQAALAAFTLARMEMDVSPARAVAALERCLAAGAPRALREDAMARLVEGYARSGRPAEARAAAANYERQFPGGRYTSLVRRWSSAP